jgi:hypothetical protein
LEEGTEDDNTGAAVEIRKLGDESTDSKDEDMSKEEEDTSEDAETSEEEDDGDGEEPSGITLHSKDIHWIGGCRQMHQMAPTVQADRWVQGNPRRNRRRPRRGRGRSRSMTVLRVERLRSVATELSK